MTELETGFAQLESCEHELIRSCMSVYKPTSWKLSNIIWAAVYADDKSVAWTVPAFSLLYVLTKVLIASVTVDWLTLHGAPQVHGGGGGGGQGCPGWHFVICCPSKSSISMKPVPNTAAPAPACRRKFRLVLSICPLLILPTSRIFAGNLPPPSYPLSIGLFEECRMLRDAGTLTVLQQIQGLYLSSHSRI